MVGDDSLNRFGIPAPAAGTDLFVTSSSAIEAMCNVRLVAKKPEYFSRPTFEACEKPKIHRAPKARGRP
jgi:hypothetical protein